ncbi:related to phosphatidyl-ethanolamine N-methyltransferase [Cephalotrichum gorgonifer]|uniref:Phosphatidylethanolamine N-methyltransferase n=1 Tax=Cephalotrichum gorgonifer TaxID=2041049 RepID=A0AAE8SYI4_9PEZI|nr:related to phosphatidyl-ethanolamine N-methyltransferase [Cephalotrichum gorgonifer]
MSSSQAKPETPASTSGGVRQRQRKGKKSISRKSIDEGVKHAEPTTEEQSGAGSEDDHEDSPRKPAKTYGRTPEGKIFTVPTTHDMVSQLLDPRQPKNLSDVGVLAILAAHIFLAYWLPSGLKRPVFALAFMFWRGMYNIGIGYLLSVQSNHRRLVAWAKKSKVFEHPETGDQPRPWLYNLLKSEFEAKIPNDYDFDKAPIEYNTWLLFRRFVDLTLMCDFVSYCLFAIVCSRAPEGESIPVYLCRWGLGIGLVGFNLWVKLDAHRVVKDYAWYWGDFFYLIDQELTFDGVFEMAPHPMYSIGYAGYYGISMMAASYDVLFISIAAHAAQLIFLVVVENPHIEKTYNPPAPRKRTMSQEGEPPVISVDEPAGQAGTPRDSPPQVHNLIGLSNLDLFRAPDYTVILLSGYMAVLALVTPSTPFYQFLFVLHATLWRFWFTVGLGVILHLQSTNKIWTRHFVKYGESTREAWSQWKSLYHISTSMCYISLFAACWKMYSAPEDWNYGWVPLKHVLGAGMVALQIWTAASVYESLGEFGWFFGDFFFDHEAKLTYKSIYRFLNNPERIFGTAAFWGAALITWSRAIFIMALLNQILTWGFLSYVEKPHMQKIYGRNLRREAGLTKFIKRSLPPPVKNWQKSMDKVWDETSGFVEEFLEAARPKLASGVKTIVRDTSALFNSYPARLSITRLSPDLAGFDPKYYSMDVEGTRVADSAASELSTGKESLPGRFRKDVKTLTFDYGTPIKVTWTAPANHDKKDWVGLYMVADNHSREVTEVPSLGRWVPTNAGMYESEALDSAISVTERPVKNPDPSGPDLVRGEVTFAGDRLWWTQGVFEFRYHHKGRHNVMAISQPFEIRIGRFADDEVEVDSAGMYERSVEQALLPIVRNCLDRDPDIAPSNAEEPFGSHVERDSKYAKRVVYAVHQMFGIEFAPAVVPADGNVKKLAWRICNAKQVLAPYSMSPSKGTSTPA